LKREPAAEGRGKRELAYNVFVNSTLTPPSSVTTFCFNTGGFPSPSRILSDNNTVYQRRAIAASIESLAAARLCRSLTARNNIFYSDAQVTNTGQLHAHKQRVLHGEHDERSGGGLCHGRRGTASQSAVCRRCRPATCFCCAQPGPSMPVSNLGLHQGFVDTPVRRGSPPTPALTIGLGRTAWSTDESETHHPVTKLRSTGPPGAARNRFSTGRAEYYRSCL